MKEANKAIVSVDMKMDLVHKIKKLHDEGLTKTVNRIAQLMESSMSEMENDHVQIRIDDFDMPTFKAVLDFVEDILMNEQGLTKTVNRIAQLMESSMSEME